MVDHLMTTFKPPKQPFLKLLVRAGINQFIRPDCLVNDINLHHMTLVSFGKIDHYFSHCPPISCSDLMF